MRGYARGVTHKENDTTCQSQKLLVNPLTPAASSALLEREKESDPKETFLRRFSYLLISNSKGLTRCFHLYRITVLKADFLLKGYYTFKNSRTYCYVKDSTVKDSNYQYLQSFTQYVNCPSGRDK